MGWVFNNPVLDAYAGNLVSAWNFDPADDLTDKIDDNDGVNVGTTDIAGINNRGRSFNKINNRIYVPHSPSIADLTAFSVFFMIKPTAPIGANQGLFSKYDAVGNKRSYLFYMLSDGSLKGIVTKDGSNAFKSDTTTPAAAVTVGAWNGCLITFGVVDKTVRIYVDGTDVGFTGDANANAIASFSDIDVSIGAWLNGGVPISFYGGIFDEVCFWDTVISPAAAPELWDGISGTFLKQAPTIDSFTATPSEVVNGTNVTLAWTTSNATAVSIDQGVGAVAVDGSTIVNPLDTTLYTITVTGPGGTIRSTALVTVGDGAIAAENIRRVLGRYRRPRR